MQSDYQRIPYNKYLKDGLDQLPKGAFLTTKKNDKINTMTIGWGTVGVMWGRPVMVIGVRPSRFTYELIDRGEEFTVSIPLNQKLKAELGFCGSKSGRSMDKLEKSGLTPIPAQAVEVPIIEECELQYECQVIAKHQLVESTIDQDILDKYYPEGDFHMIYYGEIKACYKTLDYRK